MLASCKLSLKNKRFKETVSLYTLKLVSGSYVFHQSFGRSKGAHRRVVQKLIMFYVHLKRLWNTTFSVDLHILADIHDSFWRKV